MLNSGRFSARYNVDVTPVTRSGAKGSDELREVVDVLHMLCEITFPIPLIKNYLQNRRCVDMTPWDIFRIGTVGSMYCFLAFKLFECSFRLFWWDVGEPVRMRGTARVPGLAGYVPIGVLHLCGYAL